MIPSADHLRELIKKAHRGGETYKNMSLRTGVGATVLFRFANGDHDIGGEKLLKIARAFNLTPKNAASERMLLTLARMLAESEIDPADVDAFLKKHEKVGG